MSTDSHTSFSAIGEESNAPLPDSAAASEPSFVPKENGADYFATGICGKCPSGRLRQLARAISQSPASIVITDISGLITYVNPRFEQLTGYTAAEVVGESPRVLKSGSQTAAFYEDLWRTILSGNEWRGFFHNRKKNGDYYWEQASISPMRDDAGVITHFIAVKEDITEKKRAQEELVESKQWLERTNNRLEEALARAQRLAREADAANRAKSAFLATMSHELRTPLNVVIGVASTLYDLDTALERSKASALILESGRSLLGIIEEILDYSGLQAGKVRLQSASFHLGEALANCIRSSAELARQKRLVFTYRISPTVPACLVGDARRLQQIILNLLTNGVKYTERGRVHMHVGAVRMPHGRCRLTIGIMDTGCGMSPEGVSRLFKPFERLPLGDAGVSVAGTGLGLVICQSLAKLLGGAIRVRSRVNRGSVFRCSLMFDVADQTASLLSECGPRCVTGRRVLIVDSDPYRARLLRAMLVCAGATVLTPAQLGGRPASADLAIFAPTDRASALALTALAPRRLWLASPQEVPEPLGARVRCTPASLENLADLGRTIDELCADPQQVAPSCAGACSGIPPRPASPRRALKVLAADDLRTNRETLRRILKFIGYTAEIVENGLQAVEAAKGSAYDVVILDVRMPVMDGLEAARQIKAHFASSAQCPKVVALTASALPGDREKSLEAGMDEFLSKPILPAEIVACFNRLFPEPAATRPAAPARIDSLLPPLLDCAHLDALMAGLPRHDALDMLRAMFGGVLDDYRETRGSLAAAAASQDPVMLGEAAHGLKGCFANVGWARASAHCADILAQARSGTFGNWEGLLPELDAVVAASTSAMEAHLHAASSAPV